MYIFVVSMLLTVGISLLVGSGVLIGSRKDFGHSVVMGTFGVIALVVAVCWPSPKTGSPAKWTGWAKESDVYRCEAVVGTNTFVFSSLRGKLGLIQFNPNVTLKVGLWYQATKGTLEIVSFPPPPQLAATNAATQ